MRKQYKPNKPSKWRGIQTKILLSFMLSILLPFSMLGFLSYRHYTNTVNENLIVHNETMSRLFAERVNEFFRQLEHLYFSLHGSNLLRTAGRIGEGGFDAVRYVISMNRTIDSLIAFYGLTGTVDSVLIIGQDGSILYQSGLLTPAQESTVAQILPFSEDDEIRVTLPYYSDTAQVGAHTGQHIAYFRPTGTIAGTTQRHFVVFEVRMDAIFEILESLRADATHSLALASGDTLISNIGEIELSAQTIHSDLTPSRPVSEEIDGRNILMASYPIYGTNWTFLTLIDEQYLFADAARLRNFTILLTLAAFIFASVTSLLISFSLTKPIKKIKSISERIGAGEDDIHIPLVSRDEIGELGQTMDNMLIRTRELVAEKYEMEIRQKEAQLYTLQVQINPHFLYNTMEAIRAMATVAGAENISDVAMDMVDMFRYSIKPTSTPATLRDEIEHIRHYLNILKVRHEERLQYELNIDDSLLGYPIERFLLQPLVENAVKHGIEPKRKGGKISVSTQRSGDYLILTIEDQGVGMSEETLNTLRSNLVKQRSSYQGEHIGLCNVYDRLFLRYGDSFSFEIKSEPGFGTQIVISIPVS